MMGGHNCGEFYTMFSDSFQNLLKAQIGQTEVVLKLLARLYYTLCIKGWDNISCKTI